MTATTPGWTVEILTFAMDHRNSYRHLLGLGDPPSPDDQARGREIKATVFDGFAEAVGQLGPAGLAVLLDEEYGAPLAKRAHDLGVKVCAPVERSGQAELELEYADALPRLVDTLEADLLKVLLRYNADGDRELNARQAARLGELSAWCLAQGVPLMAEVLVPMTPEQRLTFADRRADWDGARLPELTRLAIEQLRAAGADPSMWKIEGLDDACHAADIVAAVRAGGRDEVSCVVLGRGESLTRVEQWLRLAAGVPGFVGFAVGRSLWNDEALAVHTGVLGAAEARARVAAKYVRMCQVWREGVAAS